MTNLRGIVSHWLHVSDSELEDLFNYLVDLLTEAQLNKFFYLVHMEVR